jgi:hypothetical protein
MSCCRIICHSAINSHSSAICRSGEGPLRFGNKAATANVSPSIAADFESSASANSATPAISEEHRHFARRGEYFGCFEIGDSGLKATLAAQAAGLCSGTSGAQSAT